MTVFPEILCLLSAVVMETSLPANTIGRHLKELATIKQTNWFFQWTLPDGISFTVSQEKTACHLMLKKKKKRSTAANKDKPRLVQALL